MKITKKTLHQVAHLARLHIKEEEEDKLLEDMSKILDWVDQLQEVDTTGVQALTHMTEERSVLREDIVDQPMSREESLKNAPSTDGQYFKVPKVLKRNPA
jgi:aspartyl-tRNA(Asn)/glutamyl-tRNA(Gln) amidotransferase subunit C